MGMNLGILAEAQELAGASPGKTTSILSEAQGLIAKEPEEAETPFEAGQLPGGLVGEVGRRGLLPVLGQAGREAITIPVSAGQRLQEIGLQAPGLGGIQPISLEELGIDPESKQAKLGKLIGDITGFTLGTELGGAAGAGMALPGILGKIAPAIGRIAGAAGFGGLAAPEEPEAGTAITGGIQAAAETLPPALRAIGRIPGVKQVIRRIPAIAGGARKAITERLNKPLEDLRGTATHETVEEDLFERMKQYHDEVRGHDEKGFRLDKDDFEIIDEDESVGRKFEKLRNFMKEKGAPGPLVLPSGKTLKTKQGKEVLLKKHIVKSKAVVDSIDEQLNEDLLPALQRRKKTGDLQEPIKTVIKRLKNYRNFELNTFDGFDDLKEQLNEDLRDRDLMKLPKLKKAIRRIKDGLNQTLLDTAEGSGIPELEKLYKDANESYRDIQVPLEKADVSKYERIRPSKFAITRDKDSPDIKSFINKHIRADVKNDTTSGIKTLLNLLPEEEYKDNLAFSLLKESKDDPEEFMKIYSKFGKNQKELLFPKHFKEFDKLQKLKKTDPAAFKQTLSPAPFAGIGGALLPTLGGLELFREGRPKLATAALLASPILGAIAGRGASSRKILQTLLEEPAAKVAAKKAGTGGQALRGAVISNLLDRLRNRQ